MLDLTLAYRFNPAEIGTVPRQDSTPSLRQKPEGGGRWIPLFGKANVRVAPAPDDHSGTRRTTSGCAN